MDRLEALNGYHKIKRIGDKMSKVAEAYEESLYPDKDKEGVSLYDRFYEKMSELTEKDKCRFYGIACSYGICDECDIAERS